jgi:hypothetical protein
MKIVDPYEYRDRLTLPKLIMNAGNDQFFVPDSSKFYWDDLEGPKWIRYIPNVGHGLDREEAYASMASFYHAMVTDTPVPNYNFTIAKDGTIEVKLAPSANGETVQPIAVKLWQAHNPKYRDFRGAAATYTESPVEAAGPGLYQAKVDAPRRRLDRLLPGTHLPRPHAGDAVQVHLRRAHGTGHHHRRVQAAGESAQGLPHQEIILASISGGPQGPPVLFSPVTARSFLPNAPRCTLPHG